MAAVQFSSSINISGSVIAHSVTSSLLGTASYAETASWVSGSGVKGTVSSSFTASLANSASLLLSTASYAYSSSYLSGSGVDGTISSSFTSSLADSASLLLSTASQAYTASWSVSGSIAHTASYVSGAILNYPDAFTGSAVVTNIVSLSSTEFTALATKDPNTLYLVI